MDDKNNNDIINIKLTDKERYKFVKNNVKNVI